MGNKVTVKLNTKNIGELLKSDDMKKTLEKAARDHANGWETDTKMMDSRVIASIYTTDREQIREELDNHRLVGGLKK